MNNKDRLTIGLVFGFILVIMIPVIAIGVRADQADRHWCEEHGLVAHIARENTCYDPKTRLVYKPE